MALLTAGIIFAIFAADVGMGAVGGRPFLSDVQQMLTLFAAASAFVVAILRAESRSKAGRQPQDP